MLHDVPGSLRLAMWLVVTSFIVLCSLICCAALNYYCGGF